ncbi:MAG TPA: caspase family protein [Thermoanaerobaculia bacterium]|jgi:hypothetical protein
MRSRIIATTAVLAAFAITFSAEGARSRALLIGINDYTASRLKDDGRPAGGRDWANLDGALNDVDVMRELLESSYDFKPPDVVTLKDQQATRRQIVAAIARLIAATEKDDVVLFYYSGHGSQVRNSRSVEEDGLDESLVPADSRRGAADIRDKELRDWFNRIVDRGARLTVILDSCHSGSGARGQDGVRNVKPDLRDVRDASIGPEPEDRGAVILAAAQDFDPAFEMKDDVFRGAFTWALVRALRDHRDEPLDDVFARTRALLHATHPAQDPVLAGLPAVRSRPFLGNAIHRRSRQPAIAIERIEANGTYVVQGGWMSGITVGSELRFAESPDVRLRITKLRGISRAEAQRIGPASRATLPAGELLEIVNWAPPPGTPLRVWIPRAGDGVLRFARRLRETALARGIRWIDDPIEAKPEYFVRWRDGWELAGPTFITRTTTPLDGVPDGASLFVQLPAPGDLADAIRGVEGVELTDGPENADYVLAGRIGGKGVEYAYMRPGVSLDDAGKSPLPLRTAWHSKASALSLREVLERLERVHAWHDLESPAQAAAYYSLAIRRTDDGVIVEDGILLGEQTHHLVLRAKPAPRDGVFTRYIYAFVIDSAGESVLLFPRSTRGGVENRLPVTAEAGKPIANPPAEIELDQDPFIVTEPHGPDTYFLLSTDEPLLALSSLEWAGVRGEKGGRGPDDPPLSPLERLLARKLSGARGDPDTRDIRTPPNWTIEKVTFRSVEPKKSTP